MGGDVQSSHTQFRVGLHRYSMVRSPKPVEELLSVDDNTVWKIIFNEYRNSSERLDLEDLRCICIDETRSRSGQNFITVVSDPVKGRMIFGTVGKDWTTLCDLFL